MKRNLKKLSLSRETLRSLNAHELEKQPVLGGIRSNGTCGNPCTADCSNYSCETCFVRCPL